MWKWCPRKQQIVFFLFFLDARRMHVTRRNPQLRFVLAFPFRIADCTNIPARSEKKTRESERDSQSSPVQRNELMGFRSILLLTWANYWRGNVDSEVFQVRRLESSRPFCHRCCCCFLIITPSSTARIFNERIESEINTKCDKKRNEEKEKKKRKCVIEEYAERHFKGSGLATRFCSVWERICPFAFWLTLTIGFFLLVSSPMP